MYWKRPQVLGVEPESFWTGVRAAAAPAADGYRQKFLNLSGASSV